MLKEKLENIQHERAELLKKVEDLINYRPHLMAYYDFLEDERDKKEAINKLAGTKTSFMLEGWIPSPLLSSLEKVLSEKTETAFLLSRDPKAEEKAPVLLQNGGAADAFEVVTKLYSTPSRREIDPTPLMAPFFLFWFCVTDTGYGILYPFWLFNLPQNKIGGMANS